MDATANTTRTLSPSSVSNRSAPAIALSKGTRLFEFELFEVIGEGGFSIVYAARDTRLQRTVAIKEYIPSAFASRSTEGRIELRSERHRPAFEAGLHSFIDEARLLARFKHPSLVEVLRFWEGNGTAYMAMPIYEGHTLRHLLREHQGQYGEDWLRGMISPILDVLEMLHQHDIYHRDVAPDNIIVRPNGSPVLLDLGSARRVLGATDNSPTVIVKPGYTPIEQYAENAATPQGPWTDAYALGALLHLAVTGSAPAASVSRLMKDNLQPLAGQSLQGYSEQFLHAIDQSLALQPGDRPQSISQLRTLLGIGDQCNPQKLETSTARVSLTQPGHADDDARTIILSAEEMLELRNRLPGHAAPVIPDPFADHTPGNAQAVQTTGKMPELEGLLSGSNVRGSSASSISVPSSTVQPVPAPTVTPTPADTPRQKRSPVSVIGIGIVAVVIAAGAGGLLLFSPQHADRQQDRAGAGTDTPASTVAQTAYDQTVVQPLAAIAPATSSHEPESPARSDSAHEAYRPDESVAYTGEPYKPVQRPERPAAKPPERTQNEPASVSDQATRPTPPATRPAANEKAVVESGTLSAVIQPWGEVWVNGTKKGVTPPLLKLELPVGTHTVEIRNPGFPSLRKEIRLSAGQSMTLQHSFQ